jgi:hypothetical protein
MKSLHFGRRKLSGGRKSGWICGTTAWRGDVGAQRAKHFEQVGNVLGDAVGQAP